MSVFCFVRARSDNPTRGTLYIPCDKGVGCYCRFAVWQQPAAGSTWHWDGNCEAPTIQPSINCQSCGMHVFVTKGATNG